MNGFQACLDDELCEMLKKWDCEHPDQPGTRKEDPQKVVEEIWAAGEQAKLIAEIDGCVAEMEAGGAVGKELRKKYVSAVEKLAEHFRQQDPLPRAVLAMLKELKRLEQPGECSVAEQDAESCASAGAESCASAGAESCASAGAGFQDLSYVCAVAFKAAENTVVATPGPGAETLFGTTVEAILSHEDMAELRNLAKDNTGSSAKKWAGTGLTAIAMLVEAYRKAIYEARKACPADKEGLEKCAKKVTDFFSQLTLTFAGASAKFDPQGGLEDRLPQLYNFDFLSWCCRTSEWAPGEAEECAALEAPPQVLAHMRSRLNARTGGWINEHVAYKKL